LKHAQEETWVKEVRKKFDVIYVKSKEPPKLLNYLDILHEKLRFKRYSGRIVGKLDISLKYILPLNVTPKYFFDSNGEFIANSFSSYILMNRRTLAFYDWVLKDTDYSHVFTTTSASYIRLEAFENFYNKCSSSEKIIWGSRMNPDSNFVSGSGRLVSREFIKSVMSNLSRFEAHRIDDVAISLFAQNIGAEVEFWDRLDLDNYESLERFLLNKEQFSDIFHFRIKTKNRPYEDLKIMRSLHSTFKLD
jgi:hypothetical protein